MTGQKKEECLCVGTGTFAHLTDIRLSFSESLLFWFLFWVVRKSSFWMVSHVINLLAALPLNSNPKREKHKQIRNKNYLGKDGDVLVL